jgi:hypothetical protein
MATKVHGKNVNYSFNAVAIEDEIDEVELIFDVPEADAGSFADAWGNFLAGKPTVRTEISGGFDPSGSNGDKTIFDAIGGGGVSTVLSFTGGSVGASDPEYKCTKSGLTGVLVSNYRMSFPVGDKASFSATMQHSGSTTRATS